MQIGIDSFLENVPDAITGQIISPAQRVENWLEEIALADQLGLDSFGVGEHHRLDFVSSAPAVLLAAAAVRTKNIRLTSAVTVLSSDDPIRVFQDFATVDLLSKGRAEIVVGRGSFTESYPLFGHDLSDYDVLFSEKLELLLKAREKAEVVWEGTHRAPLKGEGVYPRPYQDPLPIWIGVGGSMNSFIRAGTLGLPLMVAIIGGEPHRFRMLVELYRDAGKKAGHAPEKLKVGIHTLGFLSDTTQQAADELYPAYSKMFSKIGRERGWPPTNRAAFDATRSAKGALMVGDAETVAEKILSVDEALGGLSRFTIQFTLGSLPHAKTMKAIEILGTMVAPMVRKELASRTRVVDAPILSTITT